MVLIISAISLNSFAADEVKCLSNGKIRYWEMGERHSYNSAYCYIGSEFHIESIKCKDDGCQARDYKKVDPMDLYSSKGSPGFNLCIKHYYSTPKIIEFWNGKKWIETSICEFADGSFVDTGTLEMKSR